MPGAQRRDRVRTGAKPHPCARAGWRYASMRDGPKSRSTADRLERTDRASHDTGDTREPFRVRALRRLAAHFGFATGVYLLNAQATAGFARAALNTPAAGRGRRS